ncbi:acetate/propionate family kinase [Enhygromyxa salina]|uniref:Acetate kinase n=1 Tax=Enhygromyxa salina TaxID=215803 RepID=A0A2S9YRG4_9BACT|nr:acetate/propionate family kinase [Enhygromyxa salina]PRQ07685.1 Acetate kinase [Enhygromyxa salina]
MQVLVINCGSSSIKAEIVNTESGRRHGGFVIDRIGERGEAPGAGRAGESRARLRWRGPWAERDAVGHPVAAADHAAALAEVLPQLRERLTAAAVELDGVVHRVVHGGDRFAEPARIDSAVEAAIAELIPLAPLHNPANLAGIRAAKQQLPGLEHVAVFDTAFHQTLPRRAQAYAIPTALAARHQIRRYGFHGPSHAHVAARAAEQLGEDLRDLRVITCHLGNGCSVCAVEYGRSVETSMGMTPLEGLVMGTRSGDLDPGIILHLLRSGELDVDGIDELLNHGSGLAGLSGVGNDMRDIERRAGEGDEACRLALHVFAHRLRKYIGAYAAVMGGVDAIVFTGGIGQNSALIRHRACQRLEFLGARLDEDRNRDGAVDDARPVAELSADNSRVRLLAIATDEQLEMAREAAALLASLDKIGAGRAAQPERPIPIAISARHIHLTPEAVATLFGAGHQLTPRKPLSQPGQFSCEETLDVIGPKRSIEGVRVLGPVRPACQVEISRTDEFHLGIDAPVRASGDVSNSPGITLRGPKGSLQLREGVICAWRHIHMTPDDAAHYGVADRDVVEVSVDSPTSGRDLVFGDVMVRVSPKYALEMHIDTDEANAADLNPDAEGMLVPTAGSARLTSRKVVASRLT